MFSLIFTLFIGPAGIPSMSLGPNDNQITSYEFVVDYNFQTESGCAVSTMVAFKSKEVQDYIATFLINGTIQGVNRECHEKGFSFKRMFNDYIYSR